MMYCEKCNQVTEALRCPVCGSAALRTPQENDLCFLACKPRMFSPMFQEALRDNGIAFVLRSDLGAGMAMILGEYLEKDNFYVPYSQYAEAVSILQQFDAPTEEADQKESDDASPSDTDPASPVLEPALPIVDAQTPPPLVPNPVSPQRMAQFSPYAAKLIKASLDMGAVSCVPFHISDICFDSRVLLKCMFGCADWGKGLTCPSRKGSPSMAEYREMFSRYQWGIIIGGHDKHITQKVSYAMEGKAFRDGYYFAFSLSDCGLCKECAGYCGEECRHVRQARPAFHSVGIDVFKTVRQLGLPINTLSDPQNQEQNWYAAVFVE